MVWSAGAIQYEGAEVPTRPNLPHVGGGMGLYLEDSVRVGFWCQRDLHIWINTCTLTGRREKEI